MYDERRPRMPMGRPRRVDRPTKITLMLSAACHQQLEDLCAHYQGEPDRRTVVTRSEVVERAVAALHLATISPRKKRGK
jgi:hypothetical protein